MSEAQRDVREVYVGGFFGQLVSGVVWLIAAAVGTWASPGAAMLALWLGGCVIFPVTTLALRLSRGPAALPTGHPMAPLATQIALTVPIGMLLAVALGLDRPQLFFPACMLIVGAHYLPFAFLYGMRLYVVLAATLVASGIVIAMWIPGSFSTGAWVTGIILVAFAFLLRHSIRSRPEEGPGGENARHAELPGGRRRPANRFLSVGRFPAAVFVTATLLFATGGCAAITGSGNVQSERRQVGAFTAINLTTIGHVRIEQAGSDALTIEAESNLLPELTSEVSNGTLTLGTSKNRDLRPTRDITYVITVKQLAGLTLSGSGSVTATGIDTQALSIDIGGSGRITAEGTAEAQTVSVSGSGDYDAAGLNAHTATVTISGSGDVAVNARDTLEARINGSGNITYTGNPRITKNINGSGEVRQG